MAHFLVVHRADTDEEVIINTDHIVRIARVNLEDPLKMAPEEARVHLIFVNPEYELFVRETLTIMKALIGSGGTNLISYLEDGED